MAGYSREHIPALDGLRAVAIACVLITHLWTYPAGHEILNRFAGAGWVGVDLFFVLSGFLITRILLTARETPDYFRSFYARRVRRIVPPYALLLAVVFLALPLVSRSPELENARGSWFWYVTYTSNILFAIGGFQLQLVDVTWSLAVEEQFYLAWPAIVRWCSLERVRHGCLIAVVALPVVRAVASLAGLEPRALEFLTITRFDSLAWGALVAFAEPTIKDATRRTRSMERNAVWLVVLGAVFVADCVSRGSFRREGLVVQSLGHTILGASSAALVVLCVARSRVMTVVAARPLRAVGRVSYGLYLYHSLVAVVVATVASRVGGDLTTLTGHPVVDGLCHVVLIGTVATLVAGASYRWFEHPILAWRRLPADRPARHGSRQMRHT